MTPVIFRRFKDNGDVIALFPTIPSDPDGVYITSYQHVGQHGSASYHGVMVNSFPLYEPYEYAELLAELKNQGYDDLKIYRRASREHRNELLAELKRMRTPNEQGISRGRRHSVR